MTPKKSSNKQAARARNIPRRPHEPEVEAERGTADEEDRDDIDGSDEDEESDSEADAALFKAKRKAAPRNMPLPPPTPQRVAREGEEDDLPDEVLEFVRAIDDYKRAKRRQFPSWSEVLDVLKQLGYERRTG